VSRAVPILLLVLLAPALLWADAALAATAAARLDSRKATVGSAVTLTITVSGARRVGRTHMPDLSAFDVVPGPTQMRSRSVNGRATQQIVLTYYLYPKEVGSFTIDSIGVEAGGSTQWTTPLAVDVGAAQASSGPVADHFVDAWVEPQDVYAGQLVTYHLQFGFASSVNNPEVVYPDWGGLLKEAAIEPELTDAYQVIDGRTFHVVQWRIPLFTLRPGSYEIGEAELKFDQVVGVSRRTRPLFNDPLFEQLFSTAQLRPVHLKTEPLAVEVRPLPDVGKPEGYTGLVGTARLLGDLSRNRCELGESVSLTLVLTGHGNLSDADLEIQAPEGLKVYAEDPVQEISWGQDGPLGRISRRFDLVPQVAGEALLPEIELGYFDPVRGGYRTTSAGPFNISVDPGEEQAHGAHSADLLVDERAIELLNAEPYPAALRGGSKRQGTWPRFVLTGLLLVLPLGAFGACAAIRQRRRRLADPELLRRQRARRKALDSLERARAVGPDRVACAAAAEEALRTFLHERVGIATGALSPEELGDAVEQAGAELAAPQVETWMRSVAAVRYAGRTEPTSDDLLQRGCALIDALSEEFE
jgi:hypothetical protein